jgi:hypothetical protein
VFVGADEEGVGLTMHSIWILKKASGVKGWILFCERCGSDLNLGDSSKLPFDPNHSCSELISNGASHRFGPIYSFDFGTPAVMPDGMEVVIWGEHLACLDCGAEASQYRLTKDELGRIITEEVLKTEWSSRISCSQGRMRKALG